MLEILSYIQAKPWYFFCLIAGAGAWFNKDNKDGQLMCFFACLSVFLGMVINDVSAFFISEHITYSLYALADAILAFGIYRVALRNKKYHTITLLFLLSILTHFTFQFYLLVNQPMLSSLYFSIMVYINILIIVLLLGFSNGFRAFCRLLLGMLYRFHTNKAGMENSRSIYANHKEA